MTESAFSGYLQKIQGVKLSGMAKRYAEFSRDCDCRIAAREYDGLVKKLDAGKRGESWADEVIKSLSEKPAADVKKYITTADTAAKIESEASAILKEKLRKIDERRQLSAAEWDKKIATLLSGPHTLSWCNDVEKTYAAYCKLEKSVKEYILRAGGLEIVYKDIAHIRKAVETDTAVANLYAGKRDGENFRENVDKLKKAYDGLNKTAQKYCEKTAELNEMVALAERQRREAAEKAERERRAVAESLDAAYQRVKSVTRSTDSIDNAYGFIAQWDKTAATARNLCRYATPAAVTALKKLCDSESTNLRKDREAAAAAQSWDNQIGDLCGTAFTKGSDSRSFDKEDYRLKIDKLKAEFDKAPLNVQCLCKRRGDLQRTVSEVLSARQKAAAALDAEFKRVNVTPSTRALISDGRNFIGGWKSVPPTVKALCRLVSDSVVTALTKFFTSEEKRLDEEDRIRAIKLAEEKERERKRLAAEEAARKKAALNNDINDCYAKAKRGDADAMFKLANYYFTGTGVTKSYSDAFDWYEKAAKKGNMQAMEKLGDCYYYGYGVEKSYAKAEKCYKKAAKG